jgi:hypothetical protein
MMRDATAEIQRRKENAPSLETMLRERHAQLKATEQRAKVVTPGSDLWCDLRAYEIAIAALDLGHHP